MRIPSWSISLTFVAVSLTLLAQPGSAAAQSPTSQKPAEPATVEEAARVLDLRTFPKMEGAKESGLKSLGLLMYSAKGTPKEAFEFQRQQLTKLGFKELPGGQTSPDTYYSHFRKDGFLVAVGASAVQGDPQQAGWSQVALECNGNVVLEKLPVPPGAKPFHSSLSEVSYTIATSPTETAAACRKLLLAAGWEPYGETKTPSPDQPDAGMQFFKQNAIKLQSWVMTTPAEGGKTLIRYSTELMSVDLPAPADATDLRYDDFQTNLTFESPQGKPDAIIAFYQERLGKQGWKATTEKPIVDDRQKSQFLVYRNPQRDLISLTVTQRTDYVYVTLNHQTAAEVDAEEKLAKAEAERARQEQAERDRIVNVPVPLPANARKLKKSGDNELEFSLRTGSGPAALQQIRDHFLREEWTEGNGREPGRTSGILIFTKGHARLSVSYWDGGLTDVDVKIEGTKNVALQTTATGNAVAESPPLARTPGTPAIPGLPPGVEPPVDVRDLVQKALQEAGGKKAPSGKKSTPAIPGLPALPPGVEIPTDVKDLLNKALQDPGKKQSPPATKSPPTKKSVTSKSTPAAPAVAAAPTPRTAIQPAASSAPAAANNNLRRTATEKSLGSIGSVDLTKPSKGKPTYWISPDGRHFAYLIDKGVVVDGETRKYGSELREKHEPAFIFSPDSQRNAYVVRAEKGEAVVLDGVVDKQSYNFIDCGPVFSPDSKHLAFTARRYVGGGVEYVLIIDGREADVFKDAGSWRMSFTAESRRVIYGVEIDKRRIMREMSVDGSQPPVDHPHSPALMTVGFIFGGGGQMGYIAKDADSKSYIFYDGKAEPLRFNEIMQRDVRLSADGKHLAYKAEPSGFDDVVVVDGKPSKVYGGFDGELVEGSLTLSADGRRYGYVIKTSRQQTAMIDGKTGKAYPAVSNIVFSPDSKRVAYLAVQGKAMAVVDSQEISGYDTISEPIFSPDSKSVAFWAEANKRQYLVLNGQRQKAYDDVDTPWFSPDGKRLVHLATLGDKTMVVENGKEQKPYEGIKGQLYFSPDSRRLAIVVLDGGQEMVVVDGAEGNRYDTVVTVGGGKVHCDAPDRIHYLAVRDGEIFLVDETLQP